MGKRGNKNRRLVEVDLTELDGIMEAAKVGAISDAEAKKVTTALHLMASRLEPRVNNEKSSRVLPPTGQAADDADGAPARSPRAGHGRNGYDAFTGVEKVAVPHAVLQSGCACPECLNGRLYRRKEGQKLLRFWAAPPILGTGFELESLRCNLCGEIFTADPPEGVGTEKYDETVPSMIAVLKYGSGLPFNRLAGLQRNFGVPLPASTQWMLIEEAAELIKPFFAAMVGLAAQAELLHNDDTSMKIQILERSAGDKRTGVFTTGIVAVLGDLRIALYFTGIKHAGENLSDVLARRAALLPPPIQMCDALSRNAPKGALSENAQTVLANCMSHGRRYFVPLVDNFPEECRHVLEELGKVYGQDRLAREQGLEPEERLRLHQQHSKPVMDGLEQWMRRLLEEKHVEPNGGLGQAIGYMLRHWGPLTLFLREAGAPLDNNVCERALKKAVLHRKNALFYRTVNGAEVGDLYMSFIHTCELNGVNAFDYLTELQRHADEMYASPADFMPWNYRDKVLARGDPG